MTNHTLIIAEAGVNHNGSIDLALELIDSAAEAGADVVKFQTFKAENLATKAAEQAPYQTRNTGQIETQYDMLKKLELDEKSHTLLAEHCKRRNIIFLSTPFDVESLDLLVNKFDLPYIKISSGDITNAPFLLEVAKTQKNIILSTGMCTLGDVEQALGVLAFGFIGSKEPPTISAFEKSYASHEGRSALTAKVTLLHCTTEYPAPFEDVNLNAMGTMRCAFSLAVGYSDHTSGIAIPIAAVALGAVVIEKHFTLDRGLPGPDHKASLEPDELKKMVDGIRQIEVAMGSSIKKPSAIELKNRVIGRKSVVALKNISDGEMLSSNNLSIKRPGNGISPIHYWDLLNQKAKKSYTEDDEINQ